MKTRKFSLIIRLHVKCNHKFISKLEIIRTIGITNMIETVFKKCQSCLFSNLPKRSMINNMGFIFFNIRNGNPFPQIELFHYCIHEIKTTSRLFKDHDGDNEDPDVFNGYLLVFFLLFFLRLLDVRTALLRMFF